LNPYSKPGTNPFYKINTLLDEHKEAQTLPSVLTPETPVDTPAEASCNNNLTDAVLLVYWDYAAHTKHTKHTISTHTLSTHTHTHTLSTHTLSTH
jgi:hypothetical protein